jgi:hypothetical protein
MNIKNFVIFFIAVISFCYAKEIIDPKKDQNLYEIMDLHKKISDKLFKIKDGSRDLMIWRNSSNYFGNIMDNFRFLNTHLNGSLVNKGEFLIRII